jgi:hypothetical protein
VGIVIQPRVQRRARHEVTNYRVIVTRGQRVDAAYLDQLGDPVARRGRDGGTDIIFPARSAPGAPVAVPPRLGFRPLRAGTVGAGRTTGLDSVSVFLVPFAVFCGGYPCIGRVLQRRRRIKRSSYLVTNRRVVTTWPVAPREAPVVVQAHVCAAVLPALIRRIGPPHPETRKSDT